MLFIEVGHSYIVDLLIQFLQYSLTIIVNAVIMSAMVSMSSMGLRPGE